MASSIAPNIVSDSLILYLDAVNPKSYSLSSSIWLDLSSSNIIGTLTNGASFDSSSGSIIFDGIDDSIDFITSIQNKSVFTTSFWINYIVLDPVYQSPLGDNSQAFSYHVLIFNGQIFLGLSSGFTFNPFVGVYHNPISTDSWYNFVISKDISNVVSFYQNGSLLGTASETGTVNIDKIGAGFVYDNARISNVSVYDKALSSSEVSINYESIKTRYQL